MKSTANQIKGCARINKCLSERHSTDEYLSCKALVLITFFFFLLFLDEHTCCVIAVFPWGFPGDNRSLQEMQVTHIVLCNKHSHFFLINSKPVTEPEAGIANVETLFLSL